MEPRERFKELLRARSGSRMLAPSTVGEQFYCEQKVHLSREHDAEETEAMQEGTETHEHAAADAEPIDMAAAWAAIERGERQTLLETTFVGELAEFVVLGIPDAVVFDDGTPRVVFDRKTTSITDRLFPNQRVQVWLYGRMLDSLGFDTDDLQLVVLAHDRALDREVGKRLQEGILATPEDLEPGRTQLREDPPAAVYVRRYDRDDHAEEVDWALEYWRGERDPEPTDNPAKCRACPFSDFCSHSLA